MDSTWCVVSAAGRVHHQVGPLDKSALERALGGPVKAVPLLSMVASHLRVWQAEKPTDPESNFPMRAILAGMVLGGTNVIGSVVVAGADDEGIPADILERLDKADERARTGSPVELIAPIQDQEDWPDLGPGLERKAAYEVAGGGIPMSPEVSAYVSKRVEDVVGHVYDPPRCDMCRAFQRDRQQNGVFPLPAGNVIVVHVNGVTSWDGRTLP